MKRKLLTLWRKGDRLSYLRGIARTQPYYFKQYYMVTGGVVEFGIQAPSGARFTRHQSVHHSSYWEGKAGVMYPA